MRKIVLAVSLVLVMFSCSLSEDVVRSNFENYSDFSSDGFFVSPYGYSGDYEAVGMVNFEVSQDNSQVKNSSEEELMKMAIEMAKEKGANGLMNCKCNEGYTKEYKNAVSTHSYCSRKIVYKKSYTFSALAIKIDRN